MRIHHPWHDEAFALRDKGLNKEQIARAIGISSGCVGYLFNDNGQREKARERDRKRRGTVPKESNVPANLTAQDERNARTMAAARAFAAGKIDRAELMARISR